jgi:hypothetical protein
MRIWTRAILLITATGLLGACAPDGLIVDKDWMPRRITGNIAQVEPGVYGPKARDKPPFNIYSGRRCHDCESNRSIYIHSAFEGRMTRGTTRYRYPGRLYSHLDGQLVEDTRAFFGDCLPGHSASTAVWFVRTRRDRIDWENEVQLVESLGSSLNIDTLKDPAPVVEPTLELVAQGRCREIPGTRMSTEP